MKNLWEYLVELYYSVNTLPSYALTASVLVLTNCLFFYVLLIVIFTSRRKTSMKRKLRAQLFPKLKKFFKDVLCTDKVFSDNEIVTTYNNIVGKLTTYKTSLSLDVLFETERCENFNYSNYNRMIHLLSFDNFLVNKASFSSGMGKYKTLNYIKELDIKSTESMVLPYTFSKNETIRKEARFSYLLVSENDPYRLFDEIESKDEITFWDSIELMRLLDKISEREKLQNLGKWLVNSENTSLILFLMKAIGYFKQYEAKEILVEKLNDKNSKIRAEAIQSLGVLGAEDVEEILLKKYPNETSICQKAIIKAIQQFNTGKSLNFLKNTYIKTSEKALETTIANTIYSYKNGLPLFNELKRTLSASKRVILNHVETPLIKFKEYA